MKDESTGIVQLRDVQDEDLPLFFEQQLDEDATYMAAFTAKDPSDREAFDAFWQRVRSDSRNMIQTILYAGEVAGNVLSYEHDGQRAVGYWVGKEYWGKGIATKALAAFLPTISTRPLYARAAKDNLASLRVLEKCGFVILGEDKGFSNARGCEVEEFILQLESERA